ncbi:MAG: SDR family oxidoreductase [Clostridia bacterium]|nr:SDR family oxidoreductase [Clostridia bacterium]
MGETVFITGASRGIGAESAKAFAKKGYKVGINYLKNDEAAQKVADEIASFGGTCLLVKGNVASLEDMQKNIDEVTEKLGKISVLINNAGIAYNGVFQDTSPEKWDEIFKVNVNGAYNTTSIVLPSMISEKRGRIINISSIWGMTGASCEVAYSASKAAIIGFTKALAKEVAPSNITVNCVAPGVIDTDMNASLDEDVLTQLREEIPSGRLGKAEEVASLLLHLASKDSAYLTGQVISVNGGFVL